MMDGADMNLDRLAGRVIKGFMADDEAARLHASARDAAPHGPCLEIGSYCGRSAACLGLACKEVGGILFSIDHHRGSEEQQPGQAYYDSELLDPETGLIDTLPLFRRTIRELSLENTVVPIVCRSEVAARFWRTPLSLIFIDGAHGFEDVFTDYTSWISNLLPGGYLIIHDLFFNPSEGGQGPRRVYEIALSSGLFHELPLTRTLGVLQRFPVERIADESFPLRRNDSP
jgi:MMP 1-O-methyltransferase